MTRTMSILLGLLAGLIAGICLRIWGGSAIAGLLQPLGELWLNALRMTLVPFGVLPDDGWGRGLGGHRGGQWQASRDCALHRNTSSGS